LPTRLIGQHIDGEAARELLVVPPSRFQQRCLQTSCCVVQLRLQALLPAAAGFAATAAVVGMQEFWQFIACVSQLIAQLVNPVAAAGNWGGVKGIG
jgi:hypothetical protein